MSTGHNLSDRLNDALDAIDAAGLGAATWTTALSQVRDLTGARVAQLSSLGKTAAAPYGWTTVADPEERHEFVAARVYDARVNSRRRAIPDVHVLEIRDEASFDTENDMLRHPAYGEFLRRWDYPYACLTPVVRGLDATITLSVTRGGIEGGLNAEGKRLFLALAARIRHAVKTHEILQRRTLEQVVKTFDQTSQALFACNRDGRVLTATLQGEALLAAGDRLILTGGCLSARARRAASGLLEAIARGCDDQGALLTSPMIFHDAEGERPLMVEIIAVPGMTYGFWGEAVVLVSAREVDATRVAERLARLGAATMGFTPAEEAVARDLLAGRSPTETAKRIGIAVGTVRVHVRNLYAKTGVHNQLAFAALMGALR